jgi:hypothetical protein
MNTERDTHFQGLAGVLFTELQDIMAGGYPIDVTFQKQQECIAQFLYDFAGHAAESLDPLNAGVDSAYIALLAKQVASIPDIPYLIWREQKILATDLSECPE